MSEQVRAYLIEVLEAIEEIEWVMKDLTCEEFARNVIAVRAVARDFAVIGEAAKHFPAIAKREYSQVPLGQIADIRAKVVLDRAYLKPVVLWEAVRSDLPVLKSMIEEFLDDFGGE